MSAPIFQERNIPPWFADSFPDFRSDNLDGSNEICHFLNDVKMENIFIFDNRLGGSAEASALLSNVKNLIRGVSRPGRGLKPAWPPHVSLSRSGSVGPSFILFDRIKLQIREVFFHLVPVS